MVRTSRQAAVGAVFIAVLFGINNTDERAIGQSTWLQTDIGSPRTAGTASGSGSSFTLTGAGRDIGGSADQFFFVYQAIAGDVEIRARVDSFNAAGSAKAGVMVRGDLADGAAEGSSLLLDAGSTVFQRRAQNNGNTTTVAGPTATTSGRTGPTWLRVVRTGATITSYVSTDGTAWVQVGSGSVSLGTSAYVGLAVASRNQKSTATAAFSQVSITRSTLPAGQQGADIGAPAVAGSSSFAGGSYQVHAGGADIGGVSDQFHYVYQSVSGDADVTLRVASQTNSNGLAKAGVMFREALSADAANVALLLTPSNGQLFQRRPSAAASTTSSSGGTGAAPGWVRLKRTGSLFTAYRSIDGTTWTVIGSDSIPMADAVYVGIAATGHSTTTASDIIVDNFAVTAVQPTDLPPSVTLTAPANGDTFTAPASISLTATASDPENQLSRVEFYNGSTLLGSASTTPYAFTWSSVATGTYSVSAKAYDASGQSAQSSVATVTVSQGNQPPTVSLTAPANGATFTAPASITMSATASDPENQLSRVDFYNGTTLLGSATTAPYAFAWSNVAAGTYSLSAIARDAAGLTKQSAAVSVTVSAANQPPSVSLTAPAAGTTFIAPAAFVISANASDPENQLTRVDFYNGSTLLGSDTTAPYSFSWSNVGVGTYSLSAIARDAGGLTKQSAAVSVTVSAANQLPAGQVAGDIGSPAIAGSTTYSAGTYQIRAAGTDIYNTSDQFQFVYQQATGDIDVRARVDSLAVTASWAKAGVMIRNTLAAGSSHAYALVSGDQGYAFHRRPAADGATVSDSGSLRQAPAWVRVTRAGNVFTAYESADGQTWTAIASQSITMASTVYVGIAVTSGTPSTATNAAVSAFTVTQGTPNQPPTVSLTAPANGATFTAPGSIAISANASDPENQLSRVDFYNGTTLIGSDTTAPYSFTWSNVAAGTYSLNAVARDAAGLSTQSTSVSVTVTAATLPIPTGVTFQASVDHATVTSYRVEVFAAGADPNTATPLGTIDVGKPTPNASNDITVSIPSLFTPLAPGNYLLTVAAVNSGGATRSTALSFTK